MPFSNEFLHRATKEYRVQSVEADFEIARDLLNRAVVLAAKQTEHFQPSDVDIYLHGSYANKTNIFFPSDMEIIVELKRTRDYDPEQFPHETFRLHNNYFVETNKEFNPADFANLLYDALNQLTDDSAIMADKWIELPKTPTMKHTLEIIPAFTFNHIERAPDVVTDPSIYLQPLQNGRIFKGILIYDRGVGSHIITFPKLHQSHGRAKDIATNGNFLRQTRLFKTLNKIGHRESDFDQTRGYFIQCLLFNVPNELFIHIDPRENSNSSDRIVFYKILNFLLQTDIGDFVCQNLVWELFGSAAEFWKIESGYNFIQNLKHLYTHFPSTRESLA